MRNPVLAFHGACLAALLLSTAPAAADGITVNIQSRDPAGGQFLVALFNDAAAFLETPAKAQKVAVGAGSSASVTFAGVPAGKYAVSVVHDANSNGKMDKSFIGKPKEAIGISNVPKIGRSRPSFDQAAFSYDGKAASLSITAEKP